MNEDFLAVLVFNKFTDLCFGILAENDTGRGCSIQKFNMNDSSLFDFSFNSIKADFLRTVKVQKKMCGKRGIAK